MNPVDVGDETILAVSKLFNRGQAYIPVEVREILRVNDGEKVVFILKRGEIILRNAGAKIKERKVNVRKYTEPESKPQ
jgi:bifunctional DNA-binding transcriptional regulator/antitoxin component of YhaV-PrlF toxin-antitoxin module